MTMSADIKVLKSAEEINKRVREMGAELTQKLNGREPVCVCVLSGSFIFYADLIRSIDLDLSCEFLATSSYKDQKVSSGEVEVTLDLSAPLQGRDVILIEDLIDTGLTIQFLVEMIQTRRPKSLTTVTLLRKPKAMKVKCDVDLVGWDVGNDFVVGYGIDFAGQYRNLPFIGTLPQTSN
jgi:hypoxanthine phosphoribosyltransferase